ncbi:4'-phosphopantetheinyl transferase family protein [Nocardioides pantholopis]|uniref:4'-phosphopantetheinyl transferase family protein n=1 Tax=Nocardioides pantholopis TaxID=2483798 RepID=UPI000FD8682B|nr:4'-phosphopantetheinyl transferase superfamily protein [Nocardioides pantholopis]
MQQPSPCSGDPARPPAGSLALLAADVLLGGVVLRAAPVDVPVDALAPLPDAEAPLVAGAPPARRAQFAVGRRMAREALAACGVPVAGLGADELGAPRWPTGLVGSISHVPDLAAAAVSTDLRGVGVDVAHRSPLGREQVVILLDDEERRTVESVAGAFGGVAGFAVKEATYKAVHPTLRSPLGYRDIRVTLREDGTFGAAVRDPAGGTPWRVTGWWTAAGQHVAAVATLT